MKLGLEAIGTLPLRFSSEKRILSDLMNAAYPA
jgi:hypothetical protein